MAADATSPKYNSTLVEQALFVEAIDLHPVRLTVSELTARIASDPQDGLEVETIERAICDLRRSGLFRYRNDDEVVEPTQAALRAFLLLS